MERFERTLSRRRFLVASGATAILAPKVATAQTYPRRPIRLLIGFPPGSGIDTATRIIGQWLSERLGQPVIIESKPGAATNIAVQAAIGSAADGYTLVMVTSSNAINATFFESLPFDFLRDIVPIAGFITFPMVLDTNPSVSVKTVAELIALAEANPGKISMASYGTGTTSHLAIELFKAMTGTKMVHVPYRGSPQAHIDLLSGRVNGMFDSLTASMPHIRAGAFRAIAVLGNKRFASLPNVPTMGETVPGYEASAWTGFGAPRGTPPEIIEKLNLEINAGLANQNIQARLADVAAVPMSFTSAEFASFLARETEKWAKVIREANIRAE